MRIGLVIGAATAEHKEGKEGSFSDFTMKSSTSSFSCTAQVYCNFMLSGYVYKSNLK